MSDDKFLNYLKERIESIDQKVDKLLEFKWKIVGGALAVSLIVTVAVQVISLLVGRP